MKILTGDAKCTTFQLFRTKYPNGYFPEFENYNESMQKIFLYNVGCTEKMLPSRQKIQWDIFTSSNAFTHFSLCSNEGQILKYI